jgi:hypothetical protein
MSRRSGRYRLPVTAAPEAPRLSVTASPRLIGLLSEEHDVNRQWQSRQLLRRRHFTPIGASTGTAAAEKKAAKNGE